MELITVNFSGKYGLISPPAMDLATIPLSIGLRGTFLNGYLCRRIGTRHMNAHHSRRPFEYYFTSNTMIVTRHDNE